VNRNPPPRVGALVPQWMAEGIVFCGATGVGTAMDSRSCCR
jgi:hypothetical protein